MSRPSSCRSCGASIRWVTSTETRATIPLDRAPCDDGEYVTDGDEARCHQPLFDRDALRYRSHFRTCPNAQDHSRHRKAD